MPYGTPARHTISRADEIYRGDLFYPGYSPDGRAGIRWSHLYRYDMGAPATLQAKGLVNDATSTNAPNTNTLTYTTATDGTAPLDNASRPATVTINPSPTGAAVLVYDLVQPRNVTLAVTHASSVVAVSVVVSGYDQYLQPMTESLSVTATGTSKTAAGKKAFRYVYSIALTAASDATADTIDVGFGDVFGLPFAATYASDVLLTTMDGAVSTPTIVKQDQTSPATATTGDVRGTVAFATASNGTRRFSILMHIPVQYDTPSGLTAKQSVFGIDQV